MTGAQLFDAYLAAETQAERLAIAAELARCGYLTAVQVA